MNPLPPKPRTKAEQMVLQDRWAARRWGTLVVLLLSGQVALGVVAILLATGDRSVAIVPDYYQKSMKWDDEIAAKRSSMELGWTVELLPIDQDSNSVGLSIAVRDREGVPVSLQTAILRIYHHAWGNEVQEFRLEASSDDGTLFQQACFQRAGTWQVDLQLEDQAGRRYVDSRELKVALTPSKQG